MKPTIANRRTIVPDKPQVRLNLWAIMKNCIGRDLSKIPMPVSGRVFFLRCTYVLLYIHTYTCSYILYVCRYTHTHTHTRWRMHISASLLLQVNFNEPISFTQRVMEDVSYCNILTQAASLTDSTERLAYVGAFSVSSYASTSYRVVKPFNPLLGETYELDRRAEMGWRGFCEQVCSHEAPNVVCMLHGVNSCSHMQFCLLF